LSVESSALNVERSAPRGAVFLSYASQDAEAAKRICEALRAAGVEVWFDQSELRGGDTWDAMIRKRIKECTLFVPIISANTQARAEGYFRLEWKLAVDRSHLMADDAHFLFPIVIDDTPDATARVPDKFRDVQWTRLNVKDTPETLATRVARLLSGSVAEAERARPAESRKSTAWMRNIGMVGGIAIGLIYAIRPLLLPEKSRDEAKPAAVAPAAPVAPISEARRLADKARATSVGKYDSSADDFATAEGLVKRALELDPSDGEIWALSSLINISYYSRGFDRTPARNANARAQAERALILAPDSTEALYALARWQRDNEDPGIAEATLKRLLERDPNHAGALHNLGYLYDRLDRVDEAARLYAREAQNPAAAALAGYTEFLMYFRRARFAEAEAAVRKSIAVEPSTNSQSGLAMLLLTWKGDADGAVAVLSTGPAAVRHEHRPIYIAALAHLCRRQPEEALRVLDRLADDYVSDNFYTGPKAYFVGLAHAQAGRGEAARVAWEAGLAVVDERLRKAPASRDLLLARGELLAWLGRGEEALREARTVDQLGGDLSRDWITTPVRTYAALGRKDDALPLIEQYLGFTRAQKNIGWPLTPALLRVDPRWDKIRDDPRFQALAADEKTTDHQSQATPLSEGAQLAERAKALYTRVGFTRDDLGPAEEFARRATEKEPDSAAAWGVRAGVQSAWIFRNWDASEKRRQDAQAFANRALALDPNEPEALLALGHVLREQFAGEQAVAHLRKAVAANPANVRLARALGYTLSQLRREEEGRAVLLAALPHAPRDPLLRYELALSYCSYGDGGVNPANLAAALENLDAALAIQPFASALVLKSALVAGWRGDLPAMRATLDQLEKLPLAERSEDRSICMAMWAGLLERRPDRVEAAAALTARNYFEDGVMPMRPKAWSLAQAHRQAGKENLARADWQAAEAVLRQRVKDEPADPYYKAELAITLAWLGRREEAMQVIGEVEPLWKEAPTYRTPRVLALYYAALGDAARAAPYLRQTLDENGFTTRHVVPLDPMWDKLRGQPEFEALLKEAQK